MATVVRGLVEGIGIADVLPTNPLYFTEVTIPETVEIPCEKPDMEQLISVMVDTQIISTKVAHTPVDVTSPEGQHLSGCKLIVELKLRQKVKYVADEPTQSVHAAHFENVMQSVYVVVPCNVVIGGVTYTIEEALRLGKVVITPYIEDIYAKMVDKKTIFKNIALLIDVTFRV